MVCIEAIAATLPLGSVGYEAQTNAKGERPIGALWSGNNGARVSIHKALMALAIGIW